MISRFFRKIKNIVTTNSVLIILRFQGVQVGGGAKFYGLPIIEKKNDSSIKVGKRTVIISWSTHTALGVNHPVVLRTMLKDAEIEIGNDVGISGGTICAAKRVVIGDFSLLGANVTIADTDFHPIASENRRYANTNEAAIAEVIIGRNVFIGANSIILKGVSIGDNSVIGAGSVVTKDVPENTMAAGNPCKVLRFLDDKRGIFR